MTSVQEEARGHARAMLAAHIESLKVYKQLLQAAPESLWDLLYELGEAQRRQADHQSALLSVLKRQGAL
jgi:hypothetical protein